MIQNVITRPLVNRIPPALTPYETKACQNLAFLLMNEPKYKIGDTIESDAIIGWVRSIYVLMMEDATKDDKQPQFVYGVEEPEDGHVYFFSEEELQ